MAGRTIALLTDFGIEDIYVGVMKGVMLSIHADCHFVDITHQIQPQSVRDAAFDLLNAYQYFPQETIFLVVVDPGVGSHRRPIAVQHNDYSFVAPDNGVLSYVIGESGNINAVQLDNAQYHLPKTSNTFHGRDIFAPAAAHLAKGLPLDELGTKCNDLVKLPEPVLAIDATHTHITGEVLRIDHFGNIITSIGKLDWQDDNQLRFAPRFGRQQAETIVLASDQMTVQVNQQHIAGVCRTYSDISSGELVVLIGSNGHLEVAINQGNAAANLKVAVGDRVDVQIGS